MATVKTIAEERTAIRDLFRDDFPEIKVLYDHEPKQLGDLPALTVQWTGFDPAEMATLTQGKQLRNYLIRVYVGMTDFKTGQDEAAELAEKVWNKLLAMRRLSDASNVIFHEVGGTSLHFITGEQATPMLEIRIEVQIQHRSNYRG